MSSALKYRRLLPDEEPPWSLLLSADASRSAVEEYLWRGDCFLAYHGGRLAGQFVLLETRAKVFEIMNIAVAKKSQGKGIGTKLVAKAKREAKKRGGRILEVGTGNCSFRQLAFYQRAGFRISGVDTDFFLGRYKKTYRTNGVKLQDMVRLSMRLS
ncbi:MAG: GNAT family N-acetyltransferase [Bdellovibrionales bacterium]|nr:GNAT family N-acetyltransferase [Bdellovibrionales bacterium]